MFEYFYLFVTSTIALPLRIMLKIIRISIDMKKYENSLIVMNSLREHFGTDNHMALSRS